MNNVAFRIVIPLLIVVLGGLLSAYLVETRPKAQPNLPTEKIHAVRVVPSNRATVHPEFVVYGEVASGREAEIRSMVAGRLIKLDPQYRSGSYVEAGAQLAEIDPFEYEIALRERQSDVTESRARVVELRAELAAQRRLANLLDEQLALRKRDSARLQNLVKNSQASEKAFDDAKLALNGARQQHVQGGQKIESLSARIDQQAAIVERHLARLAQAERDLADTAITSPFSGFLQGIVAAIGKRVAVGESIGRLIDASGLEIRFEMPNDDYARLVGGTQAAEKPHDHPLRGTPVRVSWRLGKTTYDYVATIERVGAEIDSSSGGVVVYAEVTEGPMELLRPGAFVEVSVPDVVYNDVIVLPETAVSDDKLIYVLSDSRLVAHKVEVVREFGDRVYVRANVDKDKQIVAELFPEIGPGLHVQAM